MQKARLFSTFIGALFPGALVILPAHAGGRVLTPDRQRLFRAVVAVGIVAAVS